MAHQHGDHSHGDHHHGHGHAPKGKPHVRWMVVAVALMLLGILAYIMTMDESVQPVVNAPPPANANP